GGRRGYTKSAARGRPLRQVDRPHRELCCRLYRVCQLPRTTGARQKYCRVTAKLCGSAGSQGRATDAVLLHAATATEEPSQNGRWNCLVGASGFHGEACGLGQG